MKRRTFLAGAGVSLFALPTFAKNAPVYRTAAAIDWGLGETALLLGIPLLGLGETAGYARWVAEPALTAQTADLGLRSTPNLDYLAALAPDIILSTPQFAAIHPVLEQVAPVKNLSIFTEDLTPLRNLSEATRELGRLFGRDTAAEALIAVTNARIGGVRDVIGGRPTRDVLVVNFHDETHLWIYGEGSLFHDILLDSGLTNAWKGPGNAWGIVNATVDQLAAFDHAALLIVDPVPPAVATSLRGRNGGNLISQLAILAPGAYRLLPPSWAFGGLNAAGRFANALAASADFLVRRHAS